ncbi:HD domain-containing protein [Siphonobacter curvatus]|uniref:Metal-dependent phosphohydrolase n=1 Tax=Siphonobacter curvatus TaxID=2094562 RepID=A0A2S7II34_9BACT|nr:HD domain-containing protein [Siphonobacter curvatus]PQA55517.1 metal-dependent phosphohydrolase [Siphonobacter curvatus]
METLEKIQEFARQAHEGQRRKYADEPYINHPIRVMQVCEAYTQELPVLAAALLHDVLEDTEVTAEEMQEFLSGVMGEAEVRRTLKLVQELTDVYTHADYPGLNRDQRKSREAERMAKVSPAAQTIKYADILDNSLDIVESESDFAPKYLIESKTLLQRMTWGDKTLHKRAAEAVGQGLLKVRGRK